MLIGDIFEREVTRPINPVVYFHEQKPEKLAEEVSEYIITGGYPKGDERHNSEGIHEQFVRLLKSVAAELKKPNGPELPAAWISGFYGSGKSSFAKLLGLGLHGVELPNGKNLGDALLGRDESPQARDFHLAWQAVTDQVKPFAVVFDVGSVARDDEHIHSAVLRQCQVAMGYCSTSNLVAHKEVGLEIDGHYEEFLKAAREAHGKPWSALKDTALAEDHFSVALHAWNPKLYPEEMAWIDANAGRTISVSVKEAVDAIEHMLKARFPGRTLFLVVDEVSQYVHDNEDRMLKLQGLVSDLGQRLRGKAWLMATGQQKLEEGAAATVTLSKLKDRFPSHLRVHLSAANIRDVVHQRLLKKKPPAAEDLRALFDRHQPDLALYAYEGQNIGKRDFVDVYPMLPGHIDLVMAITTGLRARSSRVQGDSHAIRGLLQLLGDLFREQDLVRFEVGTLITLDRIYDVLHSALDADIQLTLSQAMTHCRDNPEGRLADPALALKVLKAISLLELVQNERTKTDVELVARCLYERLGQGSQTDAVRSAVDGLRAAGFLDYSEKTGFRIQSSAGQEWNRERDKYAVSSEKIADEVREALAMALAEVDRVTLGTLPLPWQAWFGTSPTSQAILLKNERSATKLEVDLRFVPARDAESEQWVAASGNDHTLENRILWVVGDAEAPQEAARQLVRSRRMLDRYSSSEASLPQEKKNLLMQERNRSDDWKRDLRRAVEKAFLDGRLYFRGAGVAASDEGTSFASALKHYGDRIVRELYPHPVTYRVTDKELQFLFSKELSAPPAVFGEDQLGILIQDSGRYEPACSGALPKDVLAAIDKDPGITGGTLFTRFGGPPHGLSPDILKACVLGLLRGNKLRVHIPGAGELTSASDQGARELLKDHTFRKAELTVNTTIVLTPRDRVSISRLFSDHFGQEVPREDEEIANAALHHFANAREQLTEVERQLQRLPGKPEVKELEQLAKALEGCRRSRQLEPTLKALKQHRQHLSDGLSLLSRLRTDLTDERIAAIRSAQDCLDFVVPQLRADRAAEADAQALAESVETLEKWLTSARPWEAGPELAAADTALRQSYEQRRETVLNKQQEQVAQAVERVKLRDGFDKLDADQRLEVTSIIQDEAPLPTTKTTLEPQLGALQDLFRQRLARAEERAWSRLDALREEEGAQPTATVTVRLNGRELEDEAAVERFLEQLREQLLQALKGGHRVRLKGS